MIVCMKMTGLQLLLVAILSSPVIVAEDLKMEGLQMVLVAMLAPLTTVAEDLDPVEFLISKNYPRNKTLIPLPKNFDKFGDEKNDCCALKLFIEVKDFDADGTGNDDGESDNESQTETGSVTFIFEHPEIRKSDIKFIMRVEKDKAKVKSKHLLDFDNCTNIMYKTFNMYATTTITDDKDVRVVLVNGKDEKIGCNPILKPDPKEIKAAQVYMYVYIILALLIGWLFGVACGNYNKIKEKYQKVTTSKDHNQESLALAECVELEAPGASVPRDKAEKHLSRTKDDVGTKSGDSDSDSSDEERGGEVKEKFSRNKKRGSKNITPMAKDKEKYQKITTSKDHNQESQAELEELEAPGASVPRDKTEKYLPRTKDDVSTNSGDSDEERGGEVKEKVSRNKKRGGSKNNTQMAKDKEVDKCSWSTKIWKNKHLFYTIVGTCVWIVISVIILIMVPPLLTENS